jgi:hypothetical protein
MITASDRRKALELVHQVSLAGRGRVSPQVFLARICGAVSEAFNYDSVTALQFHPGSQEVSEVQAGGVLPTWQTKRWPIADTPLLAEALESRSLVILSDDTGDVTSAFALPLLSAERCLGFLAGRRTVSTYEGEADVLASVSVFAAILLKNALAREEAQHFDVLPRRAAAVAML